MNTVLEVTGLEGGYGSVQILNGIDLTVNKGEFVTIIGPNGCGKSTFLKILFGLATHKQGIVTHNGTDVSGWRSDRLVKRGIAYVPQVDNVFPSLSVRENLQMGGIQLRSRKLVECIDRACNMFPDLEPRMNDLAASLSGGERQMLAISRALISDPTLLLLDEPTAALSPRYQQQILENIDELRSGGISVLLVEQNARQALGIADRGFVLVTGENRYTDSGQALLDNDDVRRSFLGG